MTKKYELTNETININGKTLHRIKALIDFADVKSGDLGGFVETHMNLSHYKNCWIYDNAKVFDRASVYNNAKLYDNAMAFDYAQIYEDSIVLGNAVIYECAEVFGDVTILDNARVCGNTEVSYGTVK